MSGVSTLQPFLQESLRVIEYAGEVVATRRCDCANDPRADQIEDAVGDFRVQLNNHITSLLRDESDRQKAITMLYRAYHAAIEGNTDEADLWADRADKLLGMVELEPSS